MSRIDSMFQRLSTEGRAALITYITAVDPTPGRTPPLIPHPLTAKGEVFLVNVSGRGDKDTDIYRENLKELDAE